MCGQPEFFSDVRRCTKLVRRESLLYREHRALRLAASWSVDRDKLFTIGHSTRPLEDFLGLLAREGVTHLVDVRAFPASRRYPYFNAQALEKSLVESGIEY